MSKLVTNDNLKAYHAELAEHIKFLQRNTAYVLDDIVNYDGKTLKCTTAGTTAITKPDVSALDVGNTLPDGTVVWTRVDLDKRGIDYWSSSTTYALNNQVIYDDKIYKCSMAHTSTSIFDNTKWTEISASSGGGIFTWVSGTSYSNGDLVINNNRIYSCNTAHTSTTFVSDIANWIEISASITHIDDWVASTAYVQGDLVAHSAKIYRCITSHTSESTWNSTEEGKWEELSPTINEITIWDQSTAYAQNQIVIYNDCLYICITAHTSTSTFDNTKWTALGYEIATTTETNETIFGGAVI